MRTVCSIYDHEQIKIPNYCSTIFKTTNFSTVTKSLRISTVVHIDICHSGFYLAKINLWQVRSVLSTCFISISAKSMRSKLFKPSFGKGRTFGKKVRKIFHLMFLQAAYAIGIP